MGHRRQSRVAPTHHELVLLKRELEIARKGEHILERRRDGLVFILLDLLDRLQTLQAQLETEFAAVVYLHRLGAEREGEIVLRELAKARATRPELIVTETELLGLEIPFILSHHISTRVDERGYGLLGTSSLDDEIARAYEQVVEEVVRLAEMRAVIAHLLREIRRLRIRVNYLNHRLLPELEAEKRYIEGYLAEREREERYRQLWMKRRTEEDNE
ncbi:V-type ATP synthase subunit D [Halorarius litoreus]|uniref:V-type ATP synthase subunit D n=1 Tax=Halorarius litoreus TaxID=2962676 RepID=UPI0020CC1B53|nr:V-type ATP synthase subunit D [Halorarius litoreus]